jgi:signal transduction histidine kinase/ligand-binding sensor domain-containing protein/CheY-like chemotaxis protein
VSRYDGRSFTTFTIKDGLADNRVNSIFQDREGILWFGTWGGVSRYDGQRFTTFTTKDGLVDNRVWSIIQDQEGYLWFGTQGGVSRYDGKAPSTGSGQRFTTFTTKDGLADNWVRSIIQDREGHLWFGTNGGGVSRYDPKTGDRSPSTPLRSAQEETGDRRAHSTSPGQAWTTFTTRDGLVGNHVWLVFQDQEGVFWFGTQDGGVSRYDGKGFTRFTEEDMLPSNTVISILQDRDGHLWFGTVSGVSRYDGKTFTTFTVKDGLADNRVWSIIQDREGHLWFGTSGDGVSRYDRAGRRHLNDSQDRSPPPSPGESSGMGTFTTFTVKDGLASNWVRSIFQDREGYLWFGAGRQNLGGSGVTRYDGKVLTTFTTEDGLASNNVISIFQDHKGYLWFGTFEGGVSRYDPKTGDRSPSTPLRSAQEETGDRRAHSTSSGQAWTTFTTRDGLAHNSVESILQDREGYLWFGTQDGGVSRYDPETGDGKAWTTFTTKDGLASNWVRSIFQDREGNLYFGTFGGGATCYDGKTFTILTVQEGLASNGVVSVFQDREGHLWFGTNGGVSQYDGQTFQTLTRQDGMVNNGATKVFQDGEGYLWFCTLGGGVTRYRPPPPSPPPAFIDAVVADQRYEKASTLRIPSTVKLTTFEFHAISFKTRPEAIVYRYRLKGYDKDWKNTHARRVEYQDLPRGTYTFEVVAVDRDLVYSEKPATVTLRVHLPYERIGWVSALGIAVGLVAWQTARVVRRDRRLQEANSALSSANKELFGLNRELQASNQQIAEANRLKSQFLANMSHELRTPMNAIIGFTNLVLRRSGDALPERQRDNLTKVKQSGDHLLNLINDILDLSKIEAGRVDIQAGAFDVRDLIASCCATVSPLAKTGVGLSHEVSEEVGEAHTDEARLRQVLINLLSNALKFTESGEVKVKVRGQGSGVWDQGEAKTEGQVFPRSPVPGPRSPGDGWLEVAVSDTGIGIPADALGYIFDEFRQVDGTSTRRHGGTGLGLSITKRLTELLGGTIGVESEVGKGSTFTVRIPINYGETEKRRNGETEKERLPDSPTPPLSDSEGGDERGKVIVVIDDDPNVGVLLREELSGEGYRVISAGSADEGVDRVKMARPFAVTVDIIMPGKDGWQTIAMLKEDPETRGIPIIVVSVSDNRELGYRLGVTDYLVKPVNREALLSALGRLDSGRLRDILVVDDDPAMVSLVCQMLEESGFASRSASNGQEALSEIGRLRPDAVLLDLMMPVMDGFEVIERMQADPELRKVPVVVVTAKDLSGAEREILKRQASRVVQKGKVDREALVQELREALKGYERT